MKAEQKKVKGPEAKQQEQKHLVDYKSSPSPSTAPPAPQSECGGDSDSEDFEETGLRCYNRYFGLVDVADPEAGLDQPTSSGAVPTNAIPGEQPSSSPETPVQGKSTVSQPSLKSSRRGLGL